MGSDSGNDDGGAARTTIQRVKMWLLLDGPRMAVAGVAAVAIFVFVLAVSVSRFSPLGSQQPLYYAFSGLVSGNLTVITVVVAINQLVLSREMWTPKKLQSEVDGMVDYRQRIEDVADQVAPVEPLGFLRLVFETTRQQAQQLGGLSVAEADDEIADEVDEVVTTITREADEVDSLLQEGNVGTFRVLSTTLSTNFAREINQLRRIKFDHSDELPADTTEFIDELVQRLQDIDVARQYFKTVYLQQELASLSRLLFYTGLPSVTIVAASLLIFTDPGGTSVTETTLTVVIPLVVTIGLFPLTVLFAYILRTATVARRTAAIIPFTAPSQEGGWN